MFLQSSSFNTTNMKSCGEKTQREKKDLQPNLYFQCWSIDTKVEKYKNLGMKTQNGKKHKKTQKNKKNAKKTQKTKKLGANCVFTKL